MEQSESQLNDLSASFQRNLDNYDALVDEQDIMQAELLSEEAAANIEKMKRLLGFTKG